MDWEDCDERHVESVLERRASVQALVFCHRCTFVRGEHEDLTKVSTVGQAQSLGLPLLLLLRQIRCTTMSVGDLRPDLGSGNTLVPVPQALGLGRYTVCTWLFAVTFDLTAVSVGCRIWTSSETVDQRSLIEAMVTRRLQGGCGERVKVPFGNGTSRTREHPRGQPSSLPALSKLFLDVCKFWEESSHSDYLGRAECLNSVVLAS